MQPRHGSGHSSRRGRSPAALLSCGMFPDQTFPFWTALAVSIGFYLLGCKPFAANPYCGSLKIARSCYGSQSITADARCLGKAREKQLQLLLLSFPSIFFICTFCRDMGRAKAWPEAGKLSLVNTGWLSGTAASKERPESTSRSLRHPRRTLLLLCVPETLPRLRLPCPTLALDRALHLPFHHTRIYTLSPSTTMGLHSKRAGQNTNNV